MRMKLFAAALLASAMVLPGVGSAQTTRGKPVAEKVKLDVLAALPLMSDLELSPGGTKIAMTLGAGNDFGYAILDLTKLGSKPEVFARASTFKDVGQRRVSGYRWVDDRYLIIDLVSREFIALGLEFAPVVPSPMLIHADDGLLGDLSDTKAELRDFSFGHPRRDAAQHEHIGDAAGGVGAATEAEKPDPVARSVMVDDELVTIGDVGGDAAPRHRGQQLGQVAPDRCQPNLAGISAEARVVEGHLLTRVD